jgi:cell division protein FtsW (lipid II flippase)
VSQHALDASSSAAAERRLLVGAVLLSMAAYTVLGWSQSASIPAGTWTYGGSMAVAAALAHLVLRRLAPDADPVLLPAAFLLNGLGLVLIRRVDFANPTNQVAPEQVTWTFVGLIAFGLTLLLVRSTRRLTRYHYTIGLVTIVLLLLPLAPIIGQRINGAQLWVRIGPMGFQPGEAAKIGLVIFLAGYLDRKRALLSIATHRYGPLMLPEPRHLGPVLAAAGIALGIVVFQRDLGSGLLFFGVSVTMLYIATGRLAYPVIGGAVFSLGAVLAWMQFAHVQQRVAIWLDPWSRLNDEGYQIAQATFALGTGGLTGTGLGLGRPDDIPFAATDAIFAVLGEELGLLGATAVLVAYLVIVVRGYRIALTANDEVGTLLAAGLTTVLALQVFVIIGGITRVVPFTGITLPFISYGGSSLVANYVIVALLLRVSDESRRSRRPSAEASGSRPRNPFRRDRGREVTA